MTEKEQWYSNKQLFEMIQGLKGVVTSLSTEIQLTTNEMRQTREIISKYNGLREEISHCKQQISKMQNTAAGRKDVGKSIREWGGWILAVLVFITNLVMR